METTNIFQELSFLGRYLKWMDEHPVLSNIIFTVECIAMVLAILFYDFTTNP